MPGLRPDEHSDVEARLLRTLYELSVSASRTLEPAELVKLVADQACELVDGDAVALYLWDDTAGLLLPVYSNDSRRRAADDRALRPGEGAAGQAVLHRQTVVVSDYAHYPHAIASSLERGVKSIQAVPLTVGDRRVGALVVRFYTLHEVGGPDEERMLTLLAAQVAPALEATRLYASSTRERQHERALREITQALAVNLDERQVLNLAVRYSADLLRAPYARVWLVEPGGQLRCAAAEGFVHADTFKRRLAHESTSGRVARQQIVNLADAPAEPSWHFNREFGERTGLGAYLGAGLWRAGESLGVLEVMRAADHRFAETDEQVLVSLANAVAVAVSNARTHAAVEHLAQEAERRAAAAAESELSLRSVYAAIAAGVLVFGADGKIVNVNLAAEQILGRSSAGLMGMRTSDFPPSVREDGSLLEADQGPYELAMHTRQPVRRCVFGITHPDGRRRWLQADAVPILGPDGQVGRVITSFIDISEVKRSEEALRQRDAILEAIAFAAENLLTAPEWEHSIGVVLGQLGAATGVSRVYIVSAAGDRSTVGAVGQPEWTAAGVRPRLGARPETASLEGAGLGGWAATLREGGMVQGSVRSFSGHERVALEAYGVLSLLIVPIFAGPTWWGCIGFDDCREQRDWPVSAIEALKTAARTLGAAIMRRRAETERLALVREQGARAEAEAAQRRLAFLAEASKLLAASLDDETTLQQVADLVVPSMADVCFVDMTGADGSIQRVAAAAVEAFTSSIADPIGVRIDPAGDHPIAACIRSGQPHLARELTERFKRRGRAAFQSGLTVPLVTRSGTAGAITWLASADRPAFASRDLELASDLAHRCALAIDNARLYREARAAVSIRDEFLSVAAHELKTPMTSLRGYAQLLSRELDRDAIANSALARRAAMTILIQCDKLARLVSQLLDISRIESGKLALDRQLTDMSQLVRDVIEVTRTQLKDRRLAAHLPDELLVNIDPLRIEQVLTNLLDNAIKYSSEGDPIDVWLSHDAVHQTVVLTVRDHGVGVPPEHRAHIFDRFYQAQAGGPLTSMAGMGLGLYISRQIVDLHDGSIVAEFPEDGGARFVVTLPLSNASLPRGT